jgi:hypothetical protein
MPLAGFEPTIPVFKWAKIFHALDRAATVTSIFWDITPLTYYTELYPRRWNSLQTYSFRIAGFGYVM